MDIAMKRRRSTPSRFGCAVAVLAATVELRGACAGTTTWTNPDGGSWSDPANWSHGVPTEGDDAMLPALDADGYCIEVAEAHCRSLQITAEGVSLTHGTLQFATTFEVGSSRSSGSVSLSGINVTGQSFRIGVNDAHGELTLRDGSMIGAGELIAGDFGGTGVGAWAVLGRSQALVASISLSPNATTTLEYNKDGEGGVAALSVFRGGELHVTVEEGTIPFGPSFKLLQSWQAMTQEFSVVVPPSFGAYVGPVNVHSFSINAGPFSEIQSLFAAPLADVSPPIVGFRSKFGFETIWTYRQPESFQDFGFGYELSGDPLQAYIDGTVLVPLVAGPIQLTASVTTTVGSFSTPVTVDSLATPPNYYEQVDLPLGIEWPQEAYVQSAFIAPRMSADKRLVAFASDATYLVPPDLQPTQFNVFIKDRWTGLFEQVDNGGELDEQDGFGDSPSLSDDGRLITFRKRHGNLQSIWMRDRWTDEAWRVSVGPDGEVNNQSCSAPVISGNGAVILYTTASTNLVRGANGIHSLVHQYDVATRTTTLLLSQAGEVPNGSSGGPTVTPDGRYIVMRTGATNLVGDNAGLWSVVMLDTKSGAWERVDLGLDGGGDGNATSASISDDGRFVAFSSTSENLGALADYNDGDVFVRDRESATTRWISPNVPGLPLGLSFSQCAISGDGGTVAYQSYNGYTNPSLLVDLSDRVPMPTPLAVGPWGDPLETPGNFSLSHDGRDVLFCADASKLIPFSATGTAVILRRSELAPTADLTGDGLVNAGDLAILLGSWGLRGVPADLNGNGTVGAEDLAELLAGWTS